MKIPLLKTTAIICLFVLGCSKHHDDPAGGPIPSGAPAIDYSGTWAGTTSQQKPFTFVMAKSGGHNLLQEVSLKVAACGGEVSKTYIWPNAKPNVNQDGVSLDFADDTGQAAGSIYFSGNTASGTMMIHSGLGCIEQIGLTFTAAK